jgi:hypothetical protein
MSDTPTVLRIPAHQTPHHADPQNAKEFYASLGQFTVAWGRFEGHMIGALLVILNLPEANVKKLKLVEPWTEREKLWNNAFNTFSALEPYKDRALAFMKRIMIEVNNRHFAAHAIWDDFVLTASEPTIRVRRIKSRNETSIDVIDDEISLTSLREALSEVNSLNVELLEFSTFLNSLRPPPPYVRTL